MPIEHDHGTAAAGRQQSPSRATAEPQHSHSTATAEPQHTRSTPTAQLQQPQPSHRHLTDTGACTGRHLRTAKFAGPPATRAFLVGGAWPERRREVGCRSPSQRPHCKPESQCAFCVLCGIVCALRQQPCWVQLGVRTAVSLVGLRVRHDHLRVTHGVCSVAMVSHVLFLLASTCVWPLCIDSMHWQHMWWLLAAPVAQVAAVADCNPPRKIPAQILHPGCRRHGVQLVAKGGAVHALLPMHGVPRGEVPCIMQTRRGSGTDTRVGPLGGPKNHIPHST